MRERLKNEWVSAVVFTLIALGGPPSNGAPNVSSRFPDRDADGVPDASDVCPCSPVDGNVDTTGRPLGDLDGDCDVDLEDVRIMQENFTGPRPEGIRYYVDTSCPNGVRSCCTGTCSDGYPPDAGPLVGRTEEQCGEDVDPGNVYVTCVLSLGCPSDVQTCDEGLCTALDSCSDYIDPAGGVNCTEGILYYVDTLCPNGVRHCYSGACSDGYPSDAGPLVGKTQAQCGSEIDPVAAYVNCVLSLGCSSDVQQCCDGICSDLESCSDYIDPAGGLYCDECPPPGIRYYVDTSCPNGVRHCSTGVCSNSYPSDAGPLVGKTQGQCGDEVDPLGACVNCVLSLGCSSDVQTCDGGYCTSLDSCSDYVDPAGGLYCNDCPPPQGIRYYVDTSCPNGVRHCSTGVCSNSYPPDAGPLVGKTQAQCEDDVAPDDVCVTCVLSLGCSSDVQTCDGGYCTSLDSCSDYIDPAGGVNCHDTLPGIQYYVDTSFCSNGVRHCCTGACSDGYPLDAGPLVGRTQAQCGDEVDPVAAYVTCVLSLGCPSDVQTCEDGLCTDIDSCSDYVDPAGGVYCDDTPPPQGIRYYVDTTCPDGVRHCYTGACSDSYPSDAGPLVGKTQAQCGDEIDPVAAYVNCVLSLGCSSDVQTCHGGFCTALGPCSDYIDPAGGVHCD